MAEYIEISTGEPVHVDFSVFRVSVRRREVGEDGGLSVELMGPDADPREELIRFDLFRKDPHYHVPASERKPTQLDGMTPEQSLGFALDCIEKKLPELLREADYAALAGQIDPAEMAAVAGRVRTAAQRAPEPTDTKRIEITPEVRKALGQ